MTYDKLIEKINRVNEQQERDMPSLPHCSNLLYQLNKKKKGKEDYCTELVNRYLATRDITYTPDDVASYVKNLTLSVNNYMNFFWPPANNPFKAQADFNSSIIPEMLCTIFGEMIKNEDLGLEVSAQKNLTIECTFDLVEGGNVNFKNKRVDVAVVKPCEMIFNGISYELPIPLVAIECKTNLDKNMISGIEHSVDDLKKTFPSCLYFVVTELLDFNIKNNYASSGIDEMYVLRKQKRAPVRRDPNARQPLEADLILEILKNVKKTIEAMRENITDLESRMNNGKLIGGKHEG